MAEDGAGLQDCLWGDDCFHCVGAIVTSGVEKLSVIHCEGEQALFGATFIQCIVSIEGRRDGEWGNIADFGEDGDVVRDINVGLTVDESAVGCGLWVDVDDVVVKDATEA